MANCGAVPTMALDHLRLELGLLVLKGLVRVDEIDEHDLFHLHQLVETIMADITALQAASQALTDASTKLATDASAAVAAIAAHAAEGPTQDQIDAITTALTSAASAITQASTELESAVSANPAPPPPTA